MRVTQQEREQWYRDGYFVRLKCFHEVELKRLRSASGRVASAVARRAPHGTTYYLDGNRFVDHGHHTFQYEHAPGSTQLRVVEPVHDLDEEYARLVADKRLVHVMCDLLGEEAVALWTAKLNFKSSRNGSGFGWHQDSPYWIHANTCVDRLPNVFVALDDTNAENGGLRLIRGSHTQGVLSGRADGSQLEGFYTHESWIDLDQLVIPQLPAGSLLFFSPHIIHGSGANQSAAKRRALILTYQPAGGRELKSGAQSAAYQT